MSDLTIGILCAAVFAAVVAYMVRLDRQHALACERLCEILSQVGGGQDQPPAGEITQLEHLIELRDRLVGGHDGNAMMAGWRRGDGRVLILWPFLDVWESADDPKRPPGFELRTQSDLR